MIKTKDVKPLLKWAGGKRQLLNEIIKLVPTDFSVYVEPFIGGGATLFELQPKRAIINDFNFELINVYSVVKNKPSDLVSLLKEHKKNNSKDYYYNVRELDRDSEKYQLLSDEERAARIIYLNKTCYNGLFRVNASGQYNTPYGRYKNPNIVDEKTIEAISNYFVQNDVKMMSGDFSKALRRLDRQSFVYLDPPYVPLSLGSSFTGYTELGFGEKEQIRLKKECDNLTKRGIKFLQSNSDTPFIRDLYREYNIATIQSKRTINCNGERRGDVNEVLIYNY